MIEIIIEQTYSVYQDNYKQHNERRAVSTDMLSVHAWFYDLIIYVIHVYFNFGVHTLNVSQLSSQ